MGFGRALEGFAAESGGDVGHVLWVIVGLGPGFGFESLNFHVPNLSWQLYNPVPPGTGCFFFAGPLPYACLVEPTLLNPWPPKAHSTPKPTPTSTCNSQGIVELYKVVCLVREAKRKTRPFAAWTVEDSIS